MNLKIFGILLIGLFFIFPTIVKASDEHTGALSGIYFMQKVHQINETEGQCLLLFSDTRIEGIHKGDIFIISGNTKINGTVQGNIYIYDALVYLGSEAKIEGAVRTISSEVRHHKNSQIEREIRPLIPSFKLFINQESEELFSYYTDQLPKPIIEMVKIVLEIVFGFLLLPFYKNSIEQGSVILCNQSKEVMIRGITLTVMFGSIIAIFALSIIGLPIAILALLVGWILTSFGQISISLFVGWWIEKRLEVEWHIYIYYLVGITVIVVLKSIPIIGWVLTLGIIPICSLGILGQMYLNKKVYGVVFPVPYHQPIESHVLESEKIYEVLTKNLDRKERKG